MKVSKILCMVKYHLIILALTERVRLDVALQIFLLSFISGELRSNLRLF